MDSKYEHQKELERLYSRNELMPRMKKYFIDMGIPTIAQEAGMDEDFILTCVVQLALHRRADVPTMVGLTRRYFDKAQQCADALLEAAAVGFMQWDRDLRVFITNFVVDPETQKEMDMYQFPLPMVVQPRTLKTNNDTGYLVSGSKGSVILRDNHHEDDVCLDHLNRMNRVKLCLDIDTAVMVKNRWKNLDKKKDDETREDFQKRVRAFAKYEKNAYGVMHKLVQEGDEFHLTHKYDKRGRTYCVGHYINPQGNDWCKATVQFANKERIL